MQRVASSSCTTVEPTEFFIFFLHADIWTNIFTLGENAKIRIKQTVTDMETITWPSVTEESDVTLGKS